MKEETVAGLIVAACLVAVVVIAAHPSMAVTSTAPHTVAAVTPTPTVTPVPDPFAPVRWAAANVAVIALLLAIGIGVPVGIALHAWRRGWLPESFTYAPHHRNDPVAEVDEPVAALPALGGVEEFLSQGKGLAYGWRVDNGELLVDRQVRSLLVGGVQGSGKTTFVALLVAQLVRMNARVMLGDPDALNDQGLAGRLAGLGVQPEQTAQEPASVLRLVLDAQHELMNRRDQRSHADPRPYVLVVDEVPEMLRVLNARDTGRLRDALELIGGLKGRKLGVAVVMLAQGWGQAIIGSTTMRDLIPAGAVFRMRAEQAERMCGIKPGYWRAVGPDPIDLQPGEFYAVGIDSGAVRVRVPEVPPHSPMRAPAHESHFPPHPGHFSPTSQPLPGTAREVDTSGNGSRHFPPLEAAREAAILELVRQATPVSEIVKQVYGVKGGHAFQRASQEVMAIISRALPPGEESDA